MAGREMGTNDITEQGNSIRKLHRRQLLGSNSCSPPQVGAPFHYLQRTCLLVISGKKAKEGELDQLKCH